MQKAVEIAIKISKDFEANWLEELENYNLHKIFSAVYNGPETLKDKNRIVCYIIHSYDPDSRWLDLRKDRTDNKIGILTNLDADVKSDLYQGIINNKNEPVNISVFSFLEELKDWRWKDVFNFLEYASRISRFAAMETDDEKQYEKTAKDGQVTKYKEEIDISVISRVNKEKGVLLEQAHEARKKANELIEQIRKEFVSTDNAVQQDFEFSFSDTSKKKDVLSWREYIRERNERRRPIAE